MHRAQRLPKRIVIVAGILLLVTLVIAGVLLVVSPGVPRPFVDDEGTHSVGSIAEKISVEINGVQQGMFIKGRDTRNPVLLYLHGGMPDYFLTDYYPTGLDEDFTVVWWDQRGSGLSYDAKAPPSAVNPPQLIADAVALTNYLRRRFGQSKIYLMAHSGGTFIGIQLAAQAPELYHAYIGIAQLSNQLESQKLAHAYMLQRFKESRNLRMVRRLEQAPVGNQVPLSDAYLALRDGAMHGLGIGTTHDMTSVLTGLLLPSLANREYTIREKIQMWRGKVNGGDGLWNTQLSTDLTTRVTRLEIPFYFFHGSLDYTVSYPLARRFFGMLDAPVKGFYTFRKSAHSPLFEEPLRVRAIMRSDVLTRSHAMADHSDE